MSLWHPRFNHTGAGTGTPGFSSLFRMLDDFERYAGQQLTGSHGSHNVATFSPKFDVTEQDKEYVLQGELPGVAPENVDIEFTDGQTLVVRGHSERSHTEGDAGLLEEPKETKKIEAGEGSKKVAAAASTSKGKEATPEAETKPKARYWLSERSYGEFSRVFTFPSPVDEDKVRATFKDGVLDISVPKAEKKGGKKISIQ
ncbi:30 kDa heat shock protein [Staphylotrichum tortipilum]|uniref:30 kDa heat shock protein n=1 Tax=Staphylotrichum tortipilum TaxID=2831512 RepID=A0AAN6MDE2_9PEZI|nr:30 kDa heat shock protein [Staphylotrichum longicolle]